MIKSIIDVKIDGPGTRKKTLKEFADFYVKSLPAKVVRPAIKDASRRTVMKARTRSVRRVAKASRLPAGVVRKRTRMVKGNLAGARNTTVGLVFYTRGVSLGKLKPRQTKKGVRAGKHFFKGAFLAETPRGLHGFKRQGKEAYPLDVLKVPLENVEITGVMLARYANSFFPRRFLQQLDYRSKLLK